MKAMTSDTTNIYAAAQAGAEFLDKKIPDWPTRIDVGTLNMASGFKCILGQVFMSKLGNSLHTNGYEWGIKEFGFESQGEVARLGFVPPEMRCQRASGGGCTCEIDPSLRWSILAEAWIDEIKDRLDKGVVLSA